MIGVCLLSLFLFSSFKKQEPTMPFVWSERWPNFPPEEVLSPDGLASYNKDGYIHVRPEAMDFLQRFRTWLNAPIKINLPEHPLRGYRSPKENVLARGAPLSGHTQGISFDASPVPPMTMPQFLAKAKEFGWPRIIIYPTWLHLDIVSTEEEKQIILQGRV